MMHVVASSDPRIFTFSVKKKSWIYKYHQVLKLLNEQEEKIIENGKDTFFLQPMEEPPLKFIKKL
jgi:hypothetical protein